MSWIALGITVWGAAIVAYIARPPSFVGPSPIQPEPQVRSAPALEGPLPDDCISEMVEVTAESEWAAWEALTRQALEEVEG